MIDIYILENNIFQQFQIEGIINTIMLKQHWNYRKLESFSTPRELTKKVFEKTCTQIFFLDLESVIDVESGINVAKYIREKDLTAIIVFLSSHPELMLITYQSLVGAIDFIDKNLNNRVLNQRIEKCLNFAVAHSEKIDKENIFFYETSYSHVHVAFDDILYFETSPKSHCVILHMKDGELEFYGTIADIANTDRRLFKCHRSFVINLDNVIKFVKSKRIVFFKNGQYCQVARSKVITLLEILKFSREW
ncbi:LytR/AlgR family response regulator transcription factor [Streptococcus equinus]|uniref:Two component transcriptional regulator, LytTR family n=1 Tax=Streptococcus equinus TaxID=1335 RepID=A0A1G9NQ52_STREI|nr:LytTR family transcriptional regulator DNA-binding domain-containing protein [Streptococcus equinus]SDL88157.1 two component transcriptional regulator, LytTR family [Streptococcus equinus]SEI90193.1 two component transcriptional regulator, LytTR family [Streptococcus equinus]